MQPIAGKPLSECDFSFEPGDSLQVRFAKTICRGLVDNRVPRWVRLGRVIPSDAGPFSREHGGPTLWTPEPRFSHIHYIQARSIIVGFQYEARRDEKVIPLRLRSIEGRLKASLKKTTGIRYWDITEGKKKNKEWLRVQFRYDSDRSRLEQLLENMQKNTEDRRVLINNTVIALKTARKVFGWV